MKGFSPRKTYHIKHRRILLLDIHEEKPHHHHSHDQAHLHELDRLNHARPRDFERIPPPVRLLQPELRFGVQVVEVRWPRFAGAPWVVEPV